MGQTEYLERLAARFCDQAQRLEEDGEADVAEAMRRNAERARRAAALARFRDLTPPLSPAAYH